MKTLFLLLILLVTACAPLPPAGAPLPVTGISDDALALSLDRGASDPSFDLLPVLAKTGEAPAGYVPIAIGTNIQYAFTPDLSRMAVLS